MNIKAPKFTVITEQNATPEQREAIKGIDAAMQWPKSPDRQGPVTWMGSRKFGPLNLVGVRKGRIQHVLTPEAVGQLQGGNEASGLAYIESLPEYLP